MCLGQSDLDTKRERFSRLGPLRGRGSLFRVSGCLDKCDGRLVSTVWRGYLVELREYELAKVNTVILYMSELLTATPEDVFTSK